MIKSSLQSSAPQPMVLLACTRGPSILLCKARTQARVHAPYVVSTGTTGFIQPTGRLCTMRLPSTWLSGAGLGLTLCLGVLPQPVAAASLSGGAIAGIVIGCVAFVVFKTWCMWVVIRWWYRTQYAPAKNGQRGSSSGGSDTKLTTWLRGKGQGSASTNSSGSSGSGSTGTAGSSSVGGWEVKPEDVEILVDAGGSAMLLGSGSFGSVFKGLRQGVQPVAVKRLHQADPSEMTLFHKEIALMEKLSFDRNIVQDPSFTSRLPACLQFYGACLAPPHPMLVLEFMEGGDLRRALTKDRTRSLGWYGRGKSLAMDIARGLVFLHANKVVHSDLKAKNILLTKDQHEAKISDVGLARIMLHTMGNTATGAPAGTFAYAAPEMLLGEKWNEKADIYSYGVLLWELVTSDVPVRGHLRPFKIPEECPASVERIVAVCMARDPTQRPSARELYDALEAAQQ